MSDLEDVNRGIFRGVRGTNELERLYGRRFPQPNTLAGEATQLPFADTTFKRVYAHYSVPMYLGESVKVLSAADEEKIATSIAEIKRVLQPGGIARIFPVPDYQVETVEKSLSKLGLRPFTDQTEPTILPNQTFRFESFRPWDPRINRRYYVRGRYVGPPWERLLTFRT
jgi:SAM-dependent methyltransferase